MELTITLEDALTPKLQKLVAKSPSFRDKALRKTAFDLLNKIILRTPVDLGRARGGWFVGMKNLMTKGGGKGGIEIYKQGGSSEGYAQGEKEGKYSETGTGGKKVIEITNAVPYILFLEYGHSKQAPRGMVRISISEMKRTAPDVFKKEFSDSVKEFWSTYRAQKIIRRIK
jgi:hypothetical protein